MATLFQPCVSSSFIHKSMNTVMTTDGTMSRKPSSDFKESCLYFYHPSFTSIELVDDIVDRCKEPDK